MDEARLILGDRPIADLSDLRPDMPWFVARVTTLDGYAEVEPLLRRERELAEADAFDADAWEARWQELWDKGLALSLPDGHRLERDFAVHVYDDGTARPRY